PPVPAGTPITVCYPCLRSGRAAFVHDTERGMELWTPDASTDADRWELLRTPTYVTWQGERWLYCCDRPMAYLGEWQTILAGLHAPNNPRQFFEAIAGSGEDDEGEGVMLGEVYGALAGGTGPVAAYVFRCRECGAHRAHWDFE
ncbi:MAG TPA: CbrC family protein, partial [bacterium]|nr:CbrC family protein [bacterium]